MGIEPFLCFIFSIFMLFLMGSSQGCKFNVGGKSGWVLNPSEGYNHWAQRLRFQVNDTLFFKYNKLDDSVMVVTKENYNSCNAKNPIKSFTDGNSEFKFERSGPHYFITGNADHCNKGQKLIVVVLAVRPKISPPTIGPSPVLSPPSPSPAPSGQSPAQGPSSQTPASSPEGSDSPAHDGKKSFAPVLGSPGVSVVLSVAIGIGVILPYWVALLGGLN